MYNNSTRKISFICYVRSFCRMRAENLLDYGILKKMQRSSPVMGPTSAAAPADRCLTDRRRADPRVTARCVLAEAEAYNVDESDMP